MAKTKPTPDLADFLRFLARLQSLPEDQKREIREYIYSECGLDKTGQPQA